MSVTLLITGGLAFVGGLVALLMSFPAAERAKHGTIRVPRSQKALLSAASAAAVIAELLAPVSRQVSFTAAVGAIVLGGLGFIFLSLSMAVRWIARKHPNQIQVMYAA